ncbi:hypothetical protein QN414_32920, partial [Pseudomonas sp. 5S1]
MNDVQKAENIVLAAASVGTNTPSIWGTLKVEGSGGFIPKDTTAGVDVVPQLDPNTGVANENSGTVYASQVLATGSDLSAQWGTIVSTYNNVVPLNLTYSPATQNSNSVANTALAAAGVSLPTNTELFGADQTLTPASGSMLPTTPDQLSNYLKAEQDTFQGMYTTDASGNTTTTITDNTQPGDPSISITMNASNTGATVVQNNGQGAIVATMDGVGATATLNNATVNVDAGSTATIGGSNNDITAEVNAAVNLSSGSSWDVVKMMKSGEVVLASADDDITIHATNSYVSLGVEDRVAIDGSTTNVAGGIDNTVTIQGSGENVTLGSGSTLAMTGTNEEANLSNGTIWLGANTTLTGTGLTGSNDTLGGSA